MKIRQIFILMSIGLTLHASLSFAQTGQQDRRIEEKKRTLIDRMTGDLSFRWQRLVLEYGGWFDFRYTDFHDDDNDAATVDTVTDSIGLDARLWFKAIWKPPVDAGYDNEHVFYVRLKNFYSETYGSDALDNYDLDGVHVDYAYGIFDFDPFWVEVGRKYFSIGRGIAYSNVNDGLQINYKVPGWNVGVFASHTLPHEDNIDNSVPGFDKRSDRYFFGVGVGYAGIKNHTIYGYTLVQRDFSDEDPIDADQQYTYDSEYFGLGAAGKGPWQTQYFIEMIKETGEGYNFGSNTQADINAWAVDLGVSRAFKKRFDPTISFEYAYGSGDKDRSDVTDTSLGNSSGDDDNFLYFGYVPTGLALAPRLSNIHMYRAGLSLRPFQRVDLDFNFYRFFKDKKEGAIFDLQATEASKDIGYEFDIEINVEILSDLDATLEYGHFVPGEAFAATDNNNEDYLSLSMTYTF